MASKPRFQILSVILVVLCLVASAACAKPTITPVVTPTVPANTPTPEIIPAATQFALSALDGVATSQANSLQSTQAWSAQSTLDAAASATATANISASATAQVSIMAEEIGKLYSSSVITTTQGTYVSLPNFSANWAQLDFYDYLLTGQMVSNFAIQADATWDSATPSADLKNSGCGFVFRMNARGDHYLAYIGLDGWVYLYKNIQGTVTQIGKSLYSKTQSTHGGGNVLLIAHGKSINIYVDHSPIFEMQDDTFTSGLLGIALISGTNKDFGTRCEMTNINLWKQAP